MNKATAIDRAAKTVTSAKGVSLAYDVLVLATGFWLLRRDPPQEGGHGLRLLERLRGDTAEGAELLDRHKSWVCRRLALLERLDVSLRDDLQLGLLGPTAARALTALPAGNQIEVLSCVRREKLTGQELCGVAELVRGAATPHLFT